LVSLIDRTGVSYLAESFSPMDPQQFVDYRWRRPRLDPENEYWLGLISYDDAAAGFESIASSKFWRASMITATASELQTSFPKPLVSPEPISAAPWHWRWHETDQQYLENVRRIIDNISNGDYYQLNLCRYLTAERQLFANEIELRLSRNGGPFSAWIRADSLELVSFSPEEFIRINPAADRFVMTTRPIKGTMPRHSDADHDRAYAQALAQSPKDRAELTMIIDLMRNDMLHVCDFGSVTVGSPGRIESFSNVHHLVGEITGRLSRNLSMLTLIQSMCPSGSITGAPKQAVMRAIERYEQRRRGYFMGNLMLLHPASGRLRSSVLIRTMVRSGDGPFEFAVGSGVVIRSQPQSELAELWAKARVVSDI
jgi:anthranilate/para-aminobenzoate synthase component I